VSAAPAASRPAPLRWRDRLEPGLDIKVTSAIDAAGFRIRILDRGYGDMRRRRQVAIPVLRPHIKATSLTLPGARTLGTESLGGCHGQIALAPKWQAANQPQCPLSGVKRTLCGRAAMSAFDPKRTWAALDCCGAN